MVYDREDLSGQTINLTGQTTFNQCTMANAAIVTHGFAWQALGCLDLQTCSVDGEYIWA